MRRPSAALPLAVLLVGSPAFGQAKAGPEFRVNAVAAGYQYGVEMTAAPGGDFVVAWVDGGYGYSDVRAQRYDARGVALGENFQVNSQPGSAASRYYLNLAGDRRGNFVVAWSGAYPGGYGLDVVARRFDRQGAAQGPDFIVNSDVSAYEALEDLSMAPGGAFVVAWTALTLDLDLDVSARRFSAQGVAQGAEFPISETTIGFQVEPSISMAPDGSFVAMYQGYNKAGEIGAFARRFDPEGHAVGGEFRVNDATDEVLAGTKVKVAPDGTFVVTWARAAYAPQDIGAFVRRFDANAAPLGPPLRIDTQGVSTYPFTAFDAAGRFVVAWMSNPGGKSDYDVRARRFDAGGEPLGPEFTVNTFAAGQQYRPVVASDAVGNFIVAWTSQGQADAADVYAQRFGGLQPAGLAVDDGTNGVLDPGDTFTLRTRWRNASGAAQSFGGASSRAAAPSGLTLTLSAQASYGTVADGVVGACTTCFTGSLAGARPAGHLHASFSETVTPVEQGQLQPWSLHVGGSFNDVAEDSPFSRFVETVLHAGVTSGCGGDSYCPRQVATRDQMAVFLLLAKEGPGYAPPACGTPAFDDVPASSPFCPFVEELARRGVTSGCGGRNYCPRVSVTREQMAVFLLRTLDPALSPPACTTPMFGDVPAASPFCRWIEEVARRGISTGCGGGNFCPQTPITREQMAVFLTVTFALTLYGP
jgi:hypothetical protein